MADSQVPATANGNSSLMQSAVYASAAYNSVANGPLLQNVKDQHAKTTSELSALAAARRLPDNTAATGQPLTHYHSFFSELLSWNNPRASAIAYATTVATILAARYLDIIRFSLRLTWMVVGLTVLAEVIGKTVLSNGLATQVRPRNYYLVPRESFDAIVGDVHELANFFVIEAQRILFAENVPVSALAVFASFSLYYLSKIMPYWGLALVLATTVFLGPLIYTQNQEAIDHTFRQASHVVNAQTEQMRQVAGKQAAQLTSTTKQYMGDYTAKAQQMLRRRSGDAADHDKVSAGSGLPSAPTHSPLPVVPKHEPATAAPFEHDPNLVVSSL